MLLQNKTIYFLKHIERRKIAYMSYVFIHLKVQTRNKIILTNKN